MNPTELKILKKVASSQLVTKEELRKFLRDNGHEVNVNTAVKTLVTKQYLNEVRPIGSTCFVITQKGARVLKEMD
jgi:chromosome segregation and condensation protein ScpB